MSDKIPKPGEHITQYEMRVHLEDAMLEQITRMSARGCESMLKAPVSTPIALALRARLAVLDPMLLN